VDALSDVSLHRRLLARDLTALTEVHAQLAPAVFKAAYRVTSDPQAAEDVTQDTLLLLWNSPELFIPARGSLRTWLATVAHNRSVDWIRREQAARRRDRHDLDLRDEQVPDIGDVVQTVMMAERVRFALSSLPELERTPIRLAYFHGRSYRQVAKDLELAEGTVKARIRSGLRHLSLLMAAEPAS
jgi:RNA polymerase sigma factor (sigma-70 family)